LSDPYLVDWAWDSAPLYCGNKTNGLRPFDAPTSAWRTAAGQWQYQDGAGGVYVSDDGKSWRGAKGTMPHGMVTDWFPLPRVCDGCDDDGGGRVTGDVVGRVVPTHVHEAANNYTLVTFVEGGHDEAGNVSTVPNGGATVVSAAVLNLTTKCDHGRFGFPKSFWDPVLSRRLQYGWAQGGKFVGEEDSLFGELTLKANHQSLLREVTYDPRLGMLCFSPVPELAQLRTTVLASMTTPTAIPASGILSLPTPPTAANQSEIRVSFAMPTTAVTFGVRVMTPPDAMPRTFLSAGFDFSVGFTPPPAGIAAWSVVVGGRADRKTHLPVGPTATQLPLLSGVDSSVEMVLYVDQTVVEVFFMGGRVAITDFIPTAFFLPTSNNTVQGVELFASGPGVTVLNATVWAMSDTWTNVATHGRHQSRPTAAEAHASSRGTDSSLGTK
jgi:hypothetical protein